MNLISSLLFGKRTEAAVLGQTVRVVPFSERTRVGLAAHEVAEPTRDNAQDIGQRVREALRILGGAYIHAFVHETGHALAYKLLCKKDTLIEIYLGNGGGITTVKQEGLPELRQDSPRVQFLFNLSGPMMSMAFSSARLALSCLGSNLFGSSYFWTASKISSAFFMMNELYYATNGNLEPVGGDFSNIKELGTSYLAGANIALVVEAALGFLLAQQLGLGTPTEEKGIGGMLLLPGASLLIATAYHLWSQATSSDPVVILETPCLPSEEEVAKAKSE